MYYDQKIKYLELRNDEGKIGGAGFVRMECCERRWRIVLQLSGLTKERDGKAQAYLGGRGKEVNIGSLEIADGRGRLELRGTDAEDMLASGLKYAELEEARIPLAHHTVIYGNLREAGRSGRKASGGSETTQGNIETGGNGRKASEGSETTQGNIETGGNGRKAHEEDGSALESIKAGEGEQKNLEVEEKVRKNSEAEITKNEDITNKTEVANNAEGMINAEEKINVREPAMEERKGAGAGMALKAGKWEQLDAIYPHVAPFGDSRRYLQISPGDFVILKEKSYRKVNNSFLLHGYFSYKHLILHKTMKKGEPVYYVGVPGRFLDKEREVALLFGFESFEGGMEPAKEGDFGYYMMRVEL